MMQSWLFSPKECVSYATLPLVLVRTLSGALVMLLKFLQQVLLRVCWIPPALPVPRVVKKLIWLMLEGSRHVPECVHLCMFFARSKVLWSSSRALHQCTSNHAECTYATWAFCLRSMVRSCSVLSCYTSFLQCGHQAIVHNYIPGAVACKAHFGQCWLLWVRRWEPGGIVAKCVRRFHFVAESQSDPMFTKEVQTINGGSQSSWGLFC